MKKLSQNTNHIVTHGFSNAQSEDLYHKKWPNDPTPRELYRSGMCCLGCNFFAPLNEDWGICCYRRSNHYLETIFEHFVCGAFVRIEDDAAARFSDYHLYKSI